MGHIHYSHIQDIFALSPCVVGLALHNVHDIYILQMAGGVLCYCCSLKRQNLVEVSLEILKEE